MTVNMPDPTAGTRVAESITSWTPEELAGRLREIIPDRDLAAFRAALAPHTTLRSPYIAEHRFRFNNRDEVCYAMAAMLDFTGSLTVTHELVGRGVAGLRFSYVLGGRTVDAVMLFHLGDDGRIDVIEVFVRGIVPLARFGRAISWRLAQPRTGLGLVGVYTPATVAVIVTRVINGMAAWLLSRTVPPNASKAAIPPPSRSR